MSGARKSSFAAVVDARTRVVVLGSLPGDASLEARRYYAGKTNQFWRLIGGVLRRDLVAMPYDARLEALLAGGIGLWDVVASAERAGSSDSAIRKAAPNGLQAFADDWPGLRALAFNGGKPAAIGRAQMDRDCRVKLLDLPSSSGANTHSTFAEKLMAWERLRDYL